jgi:L-cysteine/cystine lyase
VDPAALRACFPVLATTAYLNAGSDGPVPAAAVEAARAEIEREAAEGRLHAHFERRGELAAELRAAYAARLGCPVEDLALTTSTTDGLATVIAGLDLGPGDEVLTSDEEHPGMYGPLIAARARRGISIRAVPLSAIVDAVGPSTRLVACSHVSWASGALAPSLAGLDIPVLLDGAQGVGAVPVDVRALGCAAYAGSGQKWLCGPDGTGMLYVAPEWRERIAPRAPGYLGMADPAAGLESALKADACRYDVPGLSAEALAFALAALETLEAFGWASLHARAARLAADLAEALAERGVEVAPRGATTLVAWRWPEAEPTRQRLAESGIAIRTLPESDLLRASVGAWNDEDDLVRLLAALEEAPAAA